MKNKLNESRSHPLQRKLFLQIKKSWLYKRKSNFFFLFLSSWLLTLLIVTQGIPAIATQSTGSQPNPIVQQPSSPSELFQQGKNYYQSGQFSQAVSVWQQAVKGYQTQGEIISQVQALNYLALAYKELGNIEQAQGAIADSIQILNNLKKNDTQHNLLLAQALNTQGTLQLLQGKTETALNTWKQAAATYERTGDTTGTLIAEINQAQALQVLGQYRQSKSLLERLIAQLQKQPDSLLKAQGLRSLGIALQTIADPRQSKLVLEKSRQISQQFNSPTDVSATLFSLGNVARDLKEYAIAWNYYQEAANLSLEHLTKVDAQLNQLSMLVNLQRWEPAQNFIPQIENDIAQLPPSRPTIYARINLAESLLKIEQARDTKFSNSDQKTIAQLLAIAVQQSKQIHDPRAEAYSLYQLGKLYKMKGQLTDAKKITEQSLQIAQEINAADIVARSSGQLAVILKQQGDGKNATAAYEIAFKNLQALRSDLIAINPDVQFDFKEGIEPIYRDWISLLLTPYQGEVSQANLKQARQVMEALQLAELDNFFQDACLDTHPVDIDKIDIQAAVIYPIILRDRLEVILSIPNQPLRHYTTQLPQEQVNTILTEFFSSLSPGYPRSRSLKASRQIYNWLIAPAETSLQNSSIKTLVFVPDGLLRNVPMAALYDGKQYLLENYNIVLSPGLQLFPQGLPQEKLSMLAAGLTEARQGFNALPGVATELQTVTQAIDAEVLLNQAFTSTSFKNIINNQDFPIIHLATHGQFSSNPNETFLLTWNDRISIQQFDLLFQKRRLGLLKPIELLVMSACQTAVGDNRATLGLAGFALRSGAKSTIGSLWSVSDESTSSLMREFYHQLTTGKRSKAEALRQAQLKVKENPLYKHPYFWASFVLVGNWL